uniref:NADP-dependent oxidoreductase domain-containing protein n=1 Tax=Moniliophthora roreri TaxID=221103 RepID=A0A0W0F7H4_MONRR
MIRALYTPTPARFLNEKMATTLSMQTKVKLRDNREIPVLGLGTYELDGDDAYRGVIWALEAGYRHIDSAEWYENEQECGRAILDFCKRENIPRSEIFYTTKLKYNNGYENVKQSIERSIKLCGLDYIDLYLIHGPIGGPQMRLESWRAICDYHKDGKLKSIGISTFGVRHMRELINSGLPLPVVHQGYVAIPKSSRQARIVSNTNIFDFELSELEMNELDSLDEGLVTDWDPTDCP